MARRARRREGADPVTLDPTTAPPAVSPSTAALTVTAHGAPAGQGAISYVGRGRSIHTNHKRLMPWRQAIVDAASDAMEQQRRHAFPLDGPLVVELTVTVAKPKSAPKTRTTWPITRSSSDIDHHARAVLDALTRAEVWRDDSQVVEVTARKVYPGEGVDALDETGVIVHVWPFDDAPLQDGAPAPASGQPDHVRASLDGLLGHLAEHMPAAEDGRPGGGP
ncbi:MAG: RusA family crossover junction endodeoxyribonuclease [Thermobifida fusca]|nr:RusA family crossover junction endodeoxyribonuclease [Thermobifida fusca]